MTPEISIIIEWENNILSDMERSFKMLEKLNSQISMVQKPIEVIVLFDPEQIENTFLERELGRMLDICDNNYCFLRIEEASGKHYYDLKNEGAKLAQGEIVIFLDSDVIPEEKWLINIVQPFYDNSDIDVVAGNSYIDCYSLYSKAFALGWFFGMRLDDSMLVKKHSGFYANNVAFRKEVLMTFPFPVMPEGVTRGACSMLKDELENVGIDVWTNTAAQVSHPPPNGLSHFCTRALAEGRDHLLTDKPNLHAFIRYYFWKRICDSLRRILHNRNQVDLSVWEAPIALTIMWSYYSIYLIGGVLTVLIPSYAKSSWRI
jgi:glycosyltransferase involved in cell wall biosynthesis